MVLRACAHYAPPCICSLLFSVQHSSCSREGTELWSGPVGEGHRAPSWFCRGNVQSYELALASVVGEQLKELSSPAQDQFSWNSRPWPAPVRMGSALIGLEKMIPLQRIRAFYINSSSIWFSLTLWAPICRLIEYMRLSTTYIEKRKWQAEWDVECALWMCPLSVCSAHMENQVGIRRFAHKLSLIWDCFVVIWTFPLILSPVLKYFIIAHWIFLTPDCSSWEPTQESTDVNKFITVWQL